MWFLFPCGRFSSTLRTHKWRKHPDKKEPVPLRKAIQRFVCRCPCKPGRLTTNHKAADRRGIRRSQNNWATQPARANQGMCIDFDSSLLQASEGQTAGS